MRAEVQRSLRRSLAECVHRDTKSHRWIPCGCPSGLSVFNCTFLSVECVVSATTPAREAAAHDQGLTVCADCQHREPLEYAVATSDLYPCRHRQDMVRLHDAGSCDGKLVEVFTCALMHGKECSLETQVPGAALCAACAHRAPGVAKSAWNEAEIAGIRRDIESPVRHRTDEWVLSPVVEEAHRRAFHELAAMETPYPGGHEGDGIVTLGGGPKYFPGAFVLVYVLRQLGCSLPIEWWMLDECECDSHMKAVAESLGGVTVVNARRVVGDRPRCWGGWQAKIWAIMESRFRRVLFLDADQIPAADPTYLFSSPGFERHGAMVWPDIPSAASLRVRPQVFRIAGLPVPGNTFLPRHNFPTDYIPHETGQSLFDKSRTWKELTLARWHSDHADYFYANGKFGRVFLGYGDVPQFWLAFGKTGREYVVAPPAGWSGSAEAGAYLQRDEAGNVVFQHRCQPTSKWKLHGENPPFPGMKHYDLCLEATEELKRQWNGSMYSGRPVKKLAGIHRGIDCDSRQRKVNLAASGAVNGLFSGASEWCVSDGRLVLKKRDGSIVGILKRSKSEWRSSDGLSLTRNGG